MPERILLIEDDFALQGNLFEILTLKGFYVEAFANPLNALKRFKEFEFDLIICDNQMKELNGLDVLNKIRAEFSCSDIPFIMITAFDDKSVFREAMTKGADDFIGKPFSSDELLLSIRKQTEKYANWKAKLEALANFSNENPSPVTRVENFNYTYQYSNPEFIKRYESLSNLERDSFNQFIKQNAKQAFHSHTNISKSLQLGNELFNVTFSSQLDKGYTNIYFSDITPLKMAEEKISKQDEFYKEILDNLPADLGVFSPNHEYLYVNPMGIKDPELRKWIIGKTDEDYIKKRSPHNREAFERRKRAFLEAKRSMTDTIFMDTYPLKDGKNQYLLRKFHPVKNHNNELDIVIGYGIDITDRVIAEQRFEKSRLKYKALFDSNPQMVFMLDNEGRILEVNNSGIIQLGYSYDELIGENLTKLFPEEYHQDAEKTVRLCFEQTFKEHQWEITKIKKDGTLMNVFEVARCIKISEAEDPVLLVVCTDISEKKRNELLLHETSELNRMLLEEMPVPVAVIEHGVIKDVNLAFCDLFKLDKTSSKDKKLFELVDSVYHDYLQNKISERYRSLTKVMDCEVVMLTNEGEKLNILINGTLFKNKGELYTLAVFNNITSIRQSEAREKETEYRSKTILNSSLDGIVLIDEDGSVLEWNKQAEHIFGYSSIEALGRKLEELIIPERLEHRHRLGFSKYKTGRKVTSFNRILEMPALHKSGHEFPIELFIVAVELEGKSVFCAFIRNIEERKKSEDNLKALAHELSKQNEDLKRFAYITSHDLRAPVINLNALLEHYDHSNPDSELNRELMTRFKLSAERISETLNDLLEVTRVKDRTQNEEKCICKVSEVFNHCVNDNKELLNGLNAHIHIDFCDIDEIYFTKSVLNSVFTNLLTNSIKYSSTERTLEIKVSTRVLYGKYVIGFSDNGLGMDMAKIKNRLFTLYQRFHNHVEGKGLGLYLVKSQLEALGCSLSVQSQEQVGTEFTITLPYEKTKN